MIGGSVVVEDASSLDEEPLVASVGAPSFETALAASDGPASPARPASADELLALADEVLKLTVEPLELVVELDPDEVAPGQPLGSQLNAVQSAPQLSALEAHDPVPSGYVHQPQPTMGVHAPHVE